MLFRANSVRSLKFCSANSLPAFLFCNGTVNHVKNCLCGLLFVYSLVSFLFHFDLAMLWSRELWSFLFLSCSVLLLIVKNFIQAIRRPIGGEEEHLHSTTKGNG